MIAEEQNTLGHTFAGRRATAYDSLAILSVLCVHGQEGREFERFDKALLGAQTADKEILWVGVKRSCFNGLDETSWNLSRHKMGIDRKLSLI